MRRVVAILGLALVATPYANAQVINQIYGGGGNSSATFTNDFIELVNPTASPISLTGFSVQYASAGGTTWQVTNLTGIIPAFSYYLVQEASGGAVGVALPTPDVIGAINMSATAGKVALVNNTTALSGANPLPNAAILDFVGFGSTASAFEGTGPTPQPSGNQTSVNRTVTGVDTNQNASDFSLLTPPVPHNTSSTPIPEPGSLALATIAVAAVCSRVVRRRKVSAS